MKTSESIKNIASALLKAQRKIGAANKGAKNPFFKSNYANLGSVMEACKEALNDEGISVLQPVHSTETAHYVETTLLHESGEFLTDEMRLQLNKEDMQQFGSAISYARRYGLQSMCFIPSEDLDAEDLMDRTSSAKQTTTAASTFTPKNSPLTTLAPVLSSPTNTTSSVAVTLTNGHGTTNGAARPSGFGAFKAKTT